MTTENYKLPTGILILVLLGMTACASVYDDRAVAMKMSGTLVDALIISQKIYEKKTEKVNVKKRTNIFYWNDLIERTRKKYFRIRCKVLKRREWIRFKSSH